jgi:hypothetical protein
MSQTSSMGKGPAVKKSIVRSRLTELLTVVEIGEARSDWVAHDVIGDARQR